MTTGTESRLGRIRQTIARRLTESKKTIPHFYIQTRVDMSQVVKARQLPHAKATITSHVIHAIGRVLAESPEFNIAWREGEVVPLKDVGVGVAIDTDAGLLVVTRPQADTPELAEIDTWLRSAAARARTLKLTPADLSPKTLVVSNMGSLPIDSFYAIIDPPDPMILAVGAISDQYMVVDGEPQVRPVSTFSLSADHRVLDGVDAARFLTAIKTELEAAA